MQKRNENQDQVRGDCIFVKRQTDFQNKLSKDVFRSLHGEISVRLINSILFLKTLGTVERLKKVFH